MRVIADAEVFQGAGAVALERQQVFAGVKDRFDALADRRQVRAAAGLVLAAGSHDARVELRELGFEVLAAVLIADEDEHLPGLALAAGHHLQTESFSSTFGEVSASVATRATMKLPMAKRDPGPPARRVRPSFFRGKQF